MPRLHRAVSIVRLWAKGEQALDWLEKAYEERDPYMVSEGPLSVGPPALRPALSGSPAPHEFPTDKLVATIDAPSAAIVGLYPGFVWFISDVKPSRIQTVTV